jgi:DNA topoisomerase-3
MGKTLVIAEKPSVAQDIVRALTPSAGKFEKREDCFESDAYVVTSAVGHLLEIQAPEEFDVKRGKWSFAHLPVIPPYFDLKPIDKTKARLGAVVKLIKRPDVTALVNACDAGREGELIFRLIEQYSGGKKGQSKPVKRLWLQSMTPQAIRDGFAGLRDAEQLDGLAAAARSRSEADWLVGINGTRAFTAFNSRDGGFFLTTVGRVQTPTLSVVVEREELIRKFVSRGYWEIHAEFAAAAGPYAGKWFDPDHRKTEGDGEKKDDRLWSEAEAKAVADAVRGRPAEVSEESKPSSKGSPGLFDLTTLQREANGRFGYSAKTTLALAQALYERHKALTYPRTDSRHLPEDYPQTAKDVLAALAGSGSAHLAPHAKAALDQDLVRPTKKVFDDSKVSDHFAIIPTLEIPAGLSEAERKIYDLVARRFIAVFFPPARYQDTVRISRVERPGGFHHFRSSGRVLVDPGWLAVYGKEADKEEDEESGKILAKVAAGEKPPAAKVDAVGLATKPPARYTEATLLGAMEGAGKTVEDDELRRAMQEKGLGTPATRAAIIEGLLAEKYLLREIRELIPTAKAFQLMTLLRGLGVEELTRAELTGAWEYKLAQMEKGKLARAEFMNDIAAMTERMVAKAKEYDRDTIPGDYATLQAPCPNCGGTVKENYRRYACVGGPSPCGFSFSKTPGGRTFDAAEAESFLRDKRIGPLDGFRSKAGWPFAAELALKYDEETKNWKLEFDFGQDERAAAEGQVVDFGDAESLGACPKCGAPVHAHGGDYVCRKAVATAEQADPSCDFRCGRVILRQTVEPDQIRKLLAAGSTDLLDKFVSARTKRTFKAFLRWDPEAGKVGFAFEPRKYPPRAGKAAADGAAGAAGGKGAGRPSAKAAKAGAKASAKAAAKPAAKKPARAKSATAGAAGKLPGPALAAVIGGEAVTRPQAMKKIWDYIKANGLQDPADKRVIRADAKLKAVFGKDAAGMFEIAGLLGPHLG